MQTYLVIITTALVITQIIRLVQNTIQLKHLTKATDRDTEMKQLWYNLISTMSTLNDSINDLKRK